MSIPVAIAAACGFVVTTVSGSTVGGGSLLQMFLHVQRTKSKITRRMTGTKSIRPRPSYPQVSHKLRGEIGRSALTQIREIRLTTVEYSVIRGPNRFHDASEDV